MPTAQEIDELKQKVVRNHLNKLSQLPPVEAPTGKAVIDRGYLTPDGKATPLGKEYLTLLDAGLMDENGELTQDGKVYSMSKKDAVYGSFEDFEKREKLGLNELDDSMIEKPGALESLGGTIKDFMTKSVPKAYYLSSQISPRLIARNVMDGNGPFANPEKKINDSLSLVKGAVMSLEPLGTGGYYKAAELAMPLTSGEKSEKETASLMLKQEYQKKRYDYDAIKGIDLLVAVTGGDPDVYKIRDTAVEQFGEEAVAADEADLELGGSMALDPTMIASFGATTVARGLGQAMGRAALNAEKTALKAMVLQTEQAGIKAQRLALEAALERAERVGANVAQRSEALKSVGKLDDAVRYDATKMRIGDKLSEVKAQIDELASTEARINQDLAGLSKRQGFGEAMNNLATKAKQFNEMPAKAVGEVTERLGAGLLKADAWLDDLATRTGAGDFYSALKGVPGLSAGVVLGPVAAVPAVSARVLASGPFLESVGRFTKILGRELIAERGSVPYWRRVANNPTISNAQKFLSHRMDELTLGGRLPEIGGQVAKGTAVSYPMNLAIEYLQDPYGKAEDIIGRAGAASLVFGGGSAGAGAMFKGDAARLKQTRINDEINFTRNLLDSQKPGYNSLPKGAKRSVATYAATFPNLNFEFVDGVPSKYDPVTNTVVINPKSTNPLRPLIAHEVAHYATVRNQITPVIHSMLLGDPETPGILRKTNGELDPDFQKFKDAYDQRTDLANIPRRELTDIAEEYFIENTVDHLVDMVESGEMSRLAGRTQASRQLSKFIETTMPRLPILKDFFFRSGGAMSAGGRLVQGNGLLADGMRELPEAKAMMRNLMKEIAGEASMQKARKTVSGEEKPNLPVRKGDPIVESFHSIFETDKNGKPLVDKDGDFIALSKGVDEARQSAGLVLIEEQTKRVNEGYMPDDGEIRLFGDTWQGRYISPTTINALASKGILNNKQIAILRNINTATKLAKGTRYTVINHPATIKGRGGKVRYASLEATLRETVPVGFSITKKGNILVHLMNVDQLNRNITSRAASKRGQSLYQGNTEAIKQDISAMMDLHAKNIKTDAYYQEKYGAKWQEHQQFINSIFGQMTNEQKNINPMFESDKIKGDGVYRTYRLDRISKATKMDGTEMPFDYEKVKVNYLPDGVMEKISPQFSESNRLTNINPNGGMMAAIMRENPNFDPKQAKTTVYRSSVGESLRPNDYVAINKKIASDHLDNLKERGEIGKLKSFIVNTEDLLLANDATEFIWNPNKE